MWVWLFDLVPVVLAPVPACGAARTGPACLLAGWTTAPQLDVHCCVLSNAEVVVLVLNQMYVIGYFGLTTNHLIISTARTRTKPTLVL
jgi:hypothetical protein